MALNNVAFFQSRKFNSYIRLSNHNISTKASSALTLGLLGDNYFGIKKDNKDSKMGTLHLEFPIACKLLQEDESKDKARLLAEINNLFADVTGRIQFFNFLLESNCHKIAYQYGLKLESKDSFNNDVRWYDSLANVVQAYEKSEPFLDLDFLLKKITILDRRTNLSMDEHQMEPRTVAQCTAVLFAYDQALWTFSKIKIPYSKVKFFNQIIEHFRAQLFFYLAILIMKQVREDHGIWPEAELMITPLLLQATQITMNFDDGSCYGKLLNMDRDIKLWKKDATFRISQAGHVLQVLTHGSDYQYLNKVCEIKWRSKVYQYVFFNGEYQQALETSYFITQPSSDDVSFHLLTEAQLDHFDKVYQMLYPESLHHLVWLGLAYLKDENQLRNDFRCTVVPDLPFSVENLYNVEPETLNQLDVDAFLHAAVLCAKENATDNKCIHRPYRLPASISSKLCSPAQAEWWSAVYKTCTKQINGNILEMKHILRKGIEAIRVFDHCCLPVKLVILLAKLFEKRAANSENSDERAGLEARTNHYWTVAVSMLERIEKNQFRITTNEFFDYKGKMTYDEVKSYIKEGQLFLTCRLVKHERCEKATEEFQLLKNPGAPSNQTLVFPDDDDDDCQKIFPYIEFSDFVKTTYGFFIKNDIVVKHIEKLIDEDPMNILPKRHHLSVAKMLAGAKKQEEDLEGGTNFVMIFCGSLLKAAQDLRKLGISYEDIKEYFKIASKKSNEILEKLCINSEKNLATGNEASEFENSQNVSRALINCEDDRESHIEIRGKELLLKGEEGDFFETRIILNEEDFCVFSGEVPECYSICYCSDILEFFFQNCMNPNNRITSQQTPTNVALYQFFNLSWIPKGEGINCIIHNMMSKLYMLRVQINWTKELGGKVIVTAGRTDNFTLTFINNRKVMLITLENESELYRLQETIGGVIITDPEYYYPDEKEMGRVDSVLIENLMEGTSIVVFKLLQEKDFQLKTLVFEDVTTSTTRITYNNTYKGDFFPSGVPEKLIEGLYSFIDELPTSNPQIVMKAFTDALKTLIEDLMVYQKRGNSTINDVEKSMLYGIGNATNAALKIFVGDN